MNRQEFLASLQSRGLRAWQANFAASFLDANAAAFHLLAAPPGTGKTYATVAITAELVSRGAKRILALTPVPLCEAWRERLTNAQSKIPVLFVTRQLFREMVAALPIGQSPWNSGGIYVVSQDLTKQSDFFDGLCSVNWDLVIVDEAHRLAASRRAGLSNRSLATNVVFRPFALLDQLMAKCLLLRLLLLSATPLPAIDQWLHPSPDHPLRLSTSLVVTSWFGELKNWDGSIVGRPRLDWSVVAYTRGPDEVAWWSRFQVLMKELETASGGNQFLIQVLTKQAWSSLFAFEQVLQRLRFHLIGEVVVNASVTQSEPPSIDEDVEPTAMDRQYKWADKTAGLKIVDECLNALDLISIDEKLNALKRLIRSIVDAKHGRIPRICVFSSYYDTISYLHTAVDDVGLPLFKVTGLSSFAERQITIEQFLQDGGLLLGTVGALSEGIAMPEVNHVVHYDLPWNPLNVEKRIGRFDRFGRHTPLTMYVLQDDSGAMPLESSMIDKLTTIREMGIDESDVRK